MPKLRINGVEVEVERGTTVLEAARLFGIPIPTLCHDDGLTPYGACRLCVVEVQVPGRAPALQASCCSPALDGISVQTHSDRVMRARRIVAELLLARAPEAEVVQRIAAELGVRDTRIRKKNDDCVYCGLCVRMCQERMGRAAIGFSGPMTIRSGFRSRAILSTSPTMQEMRPSAVAMPGLPGST